MEDFSIRSVGNQAIIKVDLSFMDIESLNRLFDRLRVEHLVRKADFGDNIAEIGSEIKGNWWEKSGKMYLEGTTHADRD